MKILFITLFVIAIMFTFFYFFPLDGKKSNFKSFKKKEEDDWVDEYAGVFIPTHAHKLKDMTKEEAKEVFGTICEIESQGHKATNLQYRLNVCYTAGLVDEHGLSV